MSTRDMTLTEFKHTTKSFDDTHTVKVSDLTNGGGRITAAQVQKELRDSVAIILKEIKTINQNLTSAIVSLQKEFYSFRDYVIEQFKKQEAFNQYVIEQFKKQEAFNQYVIEQFKKQEAFNQYVIEQFKKQEAFNNHVEDVFKRNKLFQDRVEDVFKRNNLK